MATKAIHWAQLEALLVEWDVPFELEPDFDLAGIKPEATWSQVRVESNRSPKENVEQYALQMSNGAVFPPIVLAANDKAVIDGNTRIAAARRNGRDTFPAYIVHPANDLIARAIGAAVNMVGGERLTSGELQAAARDFLEAGFNDQEIARRLGRTYEWARKFRRQTEFVERAADHPAAGKIKPVVQEKLVDIGLDAPFRLVLDAVGDGVKIDRPTADKLVTAVQATRSEQAAVEATASVLEGLKPMGQANGHRTPKERTNRDLQRLITECGKLIVRLHEVHVPLVEPLASEYRQTLLHLRTAVDGLITRLPADVA